MPNPKARANKKREKEHSILEGTFTEIIFLTQ